MKLAELLLETRTELGLSRRDVQSATGINPQYIAQIERGAVRIGAQNFYCLTGLYRLDEEEALAAYRADSPDNYEKFVYQYLTYKYGCNPVDEKYISGFLKRPAHAADPVRLVNLALKYAELGVLREIEIKTKESADKGKALPLLHLSDKYKKKSASFGNAAILRAAESLPRVFKSHLSQAIMNAAETGGDARDILRSQALEDAAMYYLILVDKASTEASLTETNDALIELVISNSKFASHMAIECMKGNLPIAGCDGYTGFNFDVEAVEI